jgi:ribosomal protein L28
MSKICQICEKKGLGVGKLKRLRGKYNPTTKKRKKPNLQWVRIPFGIKKHPYRKFAGKRVLACAKCVKRLAKAK